MTTPPVCLSIAGEPVELWPQRGVAWPAARTLLVADLHLGKGDAFRRAGIALPSGGTAADLARLDDLLRRTGARRLLILGDVLHGAVHDAPWLAQWQAWRRARADLAIEAIVGNHDRALRQAGLGMHLHEGALHEGPFVFRHVPAATGGAYAWAGHVHPVVALPGLRGRVPVFSIGDAVGVLPAFSAFTGGGLVEPAAGTRLFACAGDALVALPVPVR